MCLPCPPVSAVLNVENYSQAEDISDCLSVGLLPEFLLFTEPVADTETGVISQDTYFSDSYQAIHFIHGIQKTLQQL